MICDRCGTENIEGASFCSQCGAPLGPAPARRSGLGTVRSVLLTVLALAAVAAAGVWIWLCSVRPLTDEAVLAELPEDSVILARHESDRGREQLIEYSYREEHPYGTVDRTSRQVFYYEKGSWSMQAAPEVLEESETWTGIEGVWTQSGAGEDAWFLRLEVTGFSDGLLTGTLAYEDTRSSCEGPIELYFGSAKRESMSQPYLLAGDGFFRYNYLHVDRDGGVYFDNDRVPMTRGEAPAGTLPLLGGTGRHDRAPGSDTARLGWLMAAEEVQVLSAPGGDGEVLGTEAMGTVLAYTEQAEGWYQVEYDGGTGYVPSGSVLEVPEDGTAGVATATAKVNIRSGPGTDHKRLGTVKKGTRLIYTGETGGWYQVVYNGGVGYMAGEYVQAAPAEIPSD